MTQHGYGRLPDLGDFRDHKFSMLHGLALPSSVDLRTSCSSIDDQGQLGACTSFATGEAIRYARRKQGLQDFPLSHLYLYFNSRPANQKGVDSGASLKDTVKSAAKMGDCQEEDWPYDITRFASRPPAKSYKDALKDRALSYMRVTQDPNQMKNCLAQNFPIVIGFTVYSSFESAQVASSGIVPMPGPSEQVLGGHAVLVCGYSDIDKMFLVRNSWGTGWGMQGYFKMPYAYLLNGSLASDFWTIRTITP